MEKLVEQIVRRATALLENTEQMKYRAPQTKNVTELTKELNGYLETASQGLVNAMLIQQLLDELRAEEQIATLNPYQQSLLGLIKAYLEFHESERVRSIASELSRKQFVETYCCLPVHGLRGAGNTYLVNRLQVFLPKYDIRYPGGVIPTDTAGYEDAEILVFDAGYREQTVNDFIRFAAKSNIKLIITIGDPK